MKNPEKFRLITQDEINNWIVASERVSHLEGIFQERFNYIVLSIFKTFNCKHGWFDFNNGSYKDEELEGSFSKSYSSDTIKFCWEPSRDSDWEEFVIIDKNGDGYELTYEFPTRWLFEDFEEELIEGKKKYLAKELRKKEHAKTLAEQRKLKKKEAIANAKKKLTKEELKALGVK